MNVIRDISLVLTLCLFIAGHSINAEQISIVQNERNETLFEVLNLHGISIPNRHNNNRNATLNFSLQTNIENIIQDNQTHWTLVLADRTKVEVGITEHANQITEYSFVLNTGTDHYQYFNREVRFNYSNQSGTHWYNGYQSPKPSWPMDTSREAPAQQFTYLLDYDRYLNKSQATEAILILEHLYLNSDGFALVVDGHSPLYVERKVTYANGHIKDSLLCFSSKFDTRNLDYQAFPYNHWKKEDLAHFQLKFSVFASSNIRTVTDHVVHQSGLIPKPTRLPNGDMFSNPAWMMTTFGYGFIGNESTRAFAHEVATNQIVPNNKLITNTILGFRLYQFIRLDLFPELDLTNELHAQGMEVGITIADPTLHEEEILLAQKFCIPPAKHNCMIDFSIPVASKLYTAKVNYLTFEKQVDIYLFSGFTLNNLNFKDALVRKYPGMFVTLYVDSLSKADATVISEYGLRTQHLPIWTRLTNYAHTPFDQLLAQLIPNMLSVSVAGYSFVLPYSIGGLSYLYKPNEETFIRMLQASALMPVMSIAKPPWKYTNLTMQLTKKYLDLHEKHVPLIRELALKRITDGSPIIRPMWYVAPDDPNTYTINDQFMLGDNILVAPVVKAGQFVRVVYLPAGTWIDGNHGTQYKGPAEYSIAAPLEELPYFKRKLLQ